MNSKDHDYAYLNLCDYILDKGEYQPTRTGVGTYSVFGLQMGYDLRQGFPLLTTKKINMEAVVAELLWFLRGSRNVNDLPPKYQFIWKPWAKEDGSLGPIYGSQWIDWNGTNQIQQVLDRLKTDPTDRRLIVSAWNVSELNNMALPPCHVLFQFKAYPPYLDLMLYQRSCDVPIGVPFNLASYSLLLMMVAQEVGLVPRNFIHTMGDTHIYENQVDGIKEQLKREPKPSPNVKIANKPFWEITESDIVVEDYDPHPFIKFPVAV